MLHTCLPDIVKRMVSRLLDLKKIQCSRTLHQYDVNLVLIIKSNTKFRVYNIYQQTANNNIHKYYCDGLGFKMKMGERARVSPFIKYLHD